MRQSGFRGLLSLVLSLNIALLPTLVQADVASAFKSLLNEGATISATGPGQFSSQARNSFVAGGLDVRFPVTAAPQILSITPFRVQAGCGGVSLFFGGFSFISGQEIVKLIKAVAQNAVGLAVELVMTTLCGPCASVMQIMRKLALDAASGALNSCQIAKSLENSAQSALGIDNKQRDGCTQIGAAWGFMTDQSASQASGLCSDVGTDILSAGKWVSDKMKSIGIDPNSPAGQKFLCKQGLTCNTVWTLLNQTDLYDNSIDQNVRDKLLLMNVVGTHIMTANNSIGISSTASTAPSPLNATSGTASGGSATAAGSLANTPGATNTATPGITDFAPSMGNLAGGTANNIKNVYKLLECGVGTQTSSPDPNAQALIVKECTNTPNADGTASTFDLGELPVWDCADSGSPAWGGVQAGGYDTCIVLYPQKLKNTLIAKDQGYLPYVANLLYAGVLAVQTNQPLPPELIALIQEVPVPIYQAINVSAVYPDAGLQLVNTMSVEVAQMLIYEHINNMLQVAGRYHGDIGIPTADFDQIMHFFGELQAGAEKNGEQIAAQIVRQQTIMQQIRSVNLAIQNQVMTPELLGAHQYGTAINRAAASQ
jgi:hypothetical protein